MHNLLTDPVIRFDKTGGKRAEASLAEVYAVLMADEVDAFPALRPHQRHAWHAFLAQLGAMSMHQAGMIEPPTGASQWTALLRGLTPDFPDDEPWHLVVDDITKPAFMQPPARSTERETDYKVAFETPDKLDMLVASKNHDLKAAVAARASQDDWIFALITLQTMEGFGGAGNYGISRMNGGLGNRPAFTIAPSSRGPGAHVRRDIVALLEYRPTLLNEYPMTDGGAALLWITAWDGTPAEALLLDRLDPLYIEVCRRIRLRSHGDGALGSVKSTSKAARINSKALAGRTGDPWTPVSQKANKSLTLAAVGFTYKRVTEYPTSDDWERPVLLQPTQSEQRSAKIMQLVARAMVRGVEGPGGGPACAEGPRRGSPDGTGRRRQGLARGREGPDRRRHGPAGNHRKDRHVVEIQQRHRRGGGQALRVGVMGLEPVGDLSEPPVGTGEELLFQVRTSRSL